MDTDFKLTIEFLKNHPLDAARVLDRLGAEKITFFLQKAPPPLAAGALKLMEMACARKCLEIMDAEGAGSILSYLPVETASFLLRPMENGRRESIMGSLPTEISEPIRTLLRYPEGTVGSRMDPFVSTLPEDLTAGEALKRMKKHPPRLMDGIFVVNRDLFLVGMIRTGELALSDPHKFLTEIMTVGVARLRPQSSLRAVFSHPGWRESAVLPVVDEKGMLLGAMDYQTLRHLELEQRGRREIDPSKSAGWALGELYWLGLSGLASAAASALQQEKEEDRQDTGT